MTTILTDNQHYADIASAIRSKNGLSASYTPSEMAAAITAIPSGSSAVLGSKTIDGNGTYYASADSLDGYSQVIVNVSGAGGGLAGVIERTVTSLQDADASFVASYAFYSCPNLLSVEMPNASAINDYAFFSCISLTNAVFESCQKIGMYAFQYCKDLASVSIPECSAISMYAFMQCSSLTSIELPLCETIYANVFQSCSNLSTINIPTCKNISNGAFSNCQKLISLYLTSVSSVTKLYGGNTFTGTPIGGYSTIAGQFGSVFVPGSLYSAFIVAQYWSVISSRIVSV